MCGIGGLFSYNVITSKKDKEESYRLLSKLLIGLQIRGKEATGISIINTFKDTIKVYKLPIKASKFVKKQRFRKELMRNDYNLVLVHTRAPTVGDPKFDYNNHPIFDEEHNNVMVHNGGISNHKELRKKYPVNGIADVDSEVILAMYNYRKGKIKKALSELRGGIAMALYDKKKLYLYSNGNPLNITYFKGKSMYVFSSIEDYIKGAISTQNVKDFDIFEFDECISGYEKYANYEFSSEEFMEVAFDEEKKQMHIALEPNVETLGRYGSGSNMNQEYAGMPRNETESLNQLFDLGRQSQIQCGNCTRCLYKSCPDRNTRNALRCNEILTKEDILGYNKQFVKLKNKGYRRTATLDRNKLSELFPDGATDSELQLSGCFGGD